MKKFFLYLPLLLFVLPMMAQTEKSKPEQTIDSVKAVQAQAQRERVVTPIVIESNSLPLQPNSNSAVAGDNRIKDHTNLVNGNSTDTNDLRKSTNGTTTVTNTVAPVRKAVVRKKTIKKTKLPDSTSTINRRTIP